MNDSGRWEGLTTTPRKTKRPRRLVRAPWDDLSSWTRRSGRVALARLRHHGTQLLAGLEDRHWSRGDFHWVTSARITRHASLALADLERPKPANLNVMLFSQRRFDRVEKGVNHACAVLFGNQRTGGGSEPCCVLLHRGGPPPAVPRTGPQAVTARRHPPCIPIVRPEQA